MGQVREAKGPQERVSQVVGFAIGAACGMTVGMLLLGFKPKSSHVLPSWTGFVIDGVLAIGVVVIALVPRFHRNAIVIVLAAGLTPYLATIATVGALDVGDRAAVRLIGFGFLASIGAFYSIGLIYSRRKREVDQLIFRQSSQFAFFATVVTAVVYGTLVKIELAPAISIAWAAVLGEGAWSAAAFVLERKYS
jgi:hypothetical protein